MARKAWHWVFLVLYCLASLTACTLLVGTVYKSSLETPTGHIWKRQNYYKRTSGGVGALRRVYHCSCMGTYGTSQFSWGPFTVKLFIGFLWSSWTSVFPPHSVHSSFMLYSNCEFRYSSAVVSPPAP